MWVSVMGLVDPLCPLWVLRSRVLEQDQEPGWLAGWQAEAVSIPSRVQGLGAGSAGEVIFFLFFFPSRTADSIYF